MGGGGVPIKCSDREDYRQTQHQPNTVERRKTRLQRDNRAAPSPRPAVSLRAVDISSQSCKTISPPPLLVLPQGRNPRQRDTDHFPTRSGFERDTGERNPFCGIGTELRLAFRRKSGEGGDDGAGD